MKGREYSAEMVRPPTLVTSPAAYMLAPCFEAASFSDFVTAALLRSLFGPSSHVTLRTRRPSIAPQTVSATTATAVSLDFPTKLTPGTFFASASLKFETFPPMMGQRES